MDTSTAGAEDFESLRGLGRSEALFPKLPILNPENALRQDERGPADIRPICNKET
jgi:hypothetical protein